MATSTTLPQTNLYNLMEEAKKTSNTDIPQAIGLYHNLLNQFSDSTPEQFLSEEEVLKLQENTLISLGQLYVQSEKPELIRQLLKDGRPLFQTLPKARTAKIVRVLLDCAAMLPYSFTIQEELCKDCITWCIQEKRTFLRLRVETRLAQLYHLQNKLQLGLQSVESLLKEVKKLDDKVLMVEIHLLESKFYFTIKNLSRAKAALTAARTSANSINCPLTQQGDIDLHTGMLHIQENDSDTAYSYFLEAFDAFNSAANSSASSNLIIKPKELHPTSSTPVPTDEAKSLQAFQYMLLTKIICGHPQDVFTLLTGKYGLKWSNHIQLNPYKDIAKCYKQRSLKDFENVLEIHKESLKTDVFAHYHLQQLYDTFLEQNLLRVLEPYTQLEISHAAKLIDLPIHHVESKLSEMILDGKISGTLDQRIGQIILFDTHKLPTLYNDVLETIHNMSLVVDTLYEKAH